MKHYRAVTPSGRPTYLRTQWLQAWRSFCPVHREPLESQHSLTGSHFPSEIQIARALNERFRTIGVTRSTHVTLFAFLLAPERRVMRPLRSMEQICTRALDGHAPGLRPWSKTNASELLNMVSDVLTALINNFYYPGRLRETLYVPRLPRRCIELLAWRQPYRSAAAINSGLLTICDLADPAVRRTALLHAAHWLGICELRKPSVRGGRPRLSSRLEKRILAFQSLPVPAQEWLIEQIPAWPKEAAALWRSAADARHRKIDIYAKWRQG
jgi:hypothetical protein